MSRDSNKEGDIKVGENYYSAGRLTEENLSPRSKTRSQNKQNQSNSD